MVYKIPDDKEIAVKTHAMNDVQLIFQPFTNFLRHRVIAARYLFLAKLPEILLIRQPFRQGELRQIMLTKNKIYLTAVGNELCIGKRIFIHIRREKLLHLRHILQIEVIGGEFHPSRLVYCSSGLNAEKYIVI